MEMKTPRGKMDLYMQRTDTLASSINEDHDGRSEIYPSNPIEEKDREIVALLMELGVLKGASGANADLKESLTKLSSYIVITSHVHFLIYHVPNLVLQESDKTLYPAKCLSQP